MLRLARDGAAGIDPDVFDRTWTPNGHAVEARVYAEDTAKGSLPSSGLVTQAVFPSATTASGERTGIRVDGWVDTASAKIVLFQGDSIRSTVPSETGRFVFDDVPAGLTKVQLTTAVDREERTLSTPQFEL